MLFCRQNCEAHERRLVNRNGIDVECRDLDPASNRLQLSLPRRLISIRMRRWAAQTANLHCVGKKLPRMMPDGVQRLTRHVSVIKDDESQARLLATAFVGKVMRSLFSVRPLRYRFSCYAVVLSLNDC